ncbi:MAG: Tm-1-like ATP-binding domain-containing protein [Nitrososphaerota archaeon]
MKGKNIAILGTLDTKGEQLAYLKEEIRRRGHSPILIDLSMGSISEIKADIGPDEVLSYVGKDLKDIHGSKDRHVITEVMTQATKLVLLDLLSKKKLDGVIGLGGITMANLASRAMRDLPFGLPKVIVVPAAMPAYNPEWFAGVDIVVMQGLIDFVGMNDFVKIIVEQAAGIICGMVEGTSEYSSLALPYPSVAMTEFGICPNCGRLVKDLLTEKGYYVITFHAQGISDRAMDRLIGQGFFDGLVDLAPAGLIETALKGNRAAGFDRLDAPMKRGIPVVLAPCGLNVTGCGPTRIDREKYASRPRIWQMDALRAFTRLNEEELLLCARLYAEKLNAAKGPVKFLFPLNGFSAIDKPGTVLHSPEEDRILLNELKRLVNNPNVEIIEIDANLEDPTFAMAIIESFEEIFQRRHQNG